MQTTWLPTAEVERVAPAEIKDIELGMEALAALADGADAQARLGNLVQAYHASSRS
ncbi:MAG: hypothetical protein HYW07_08335 [Candidatus Latescibacteria bacterium]|nr:hypothetical protein [Candidatus Latescibacterota bacterium]